MTPADAVWGGLLLAGAAVEAFALVSKRDGDTLSERTRSWFRVNTRAGRIVFAAGWSAFAVWFLVHILT